MTTCDHCSNLKFRFVLSEFCCLFCSFLRITIVYMHAQSTINAERDVLLKIKCTAVAILGGSDIIAPTMKLPEGIRQELLSCFTNRLNEQERFLFSFRNACSMLKNATDPDAMRISKHQRKNRSGKRTFNNVSAYVRPHSLSPNRNFRNIRRYLKSISSTMHTHVPQIDWF